MSTSAGSPALTLVGPLAGGSLLSRVGDRLLLTVVAKASFDFVPESSMRVAAPEPVFAHDQHNGGSPNRSVRSTRDLVPYLPGADVVFNGQAYAADRVPVQRMTVRLAVLRDRYLVDKSLVVVGNRTGGDPETFVQMPIVYERAFGGVGDPNNPFGVGRGRTPRFPNIEHPARPGEVAGFGPISEHLPARDGLLRPGDEAGIARPIPEYTAKFDWMFYMAAPPDQRTAYLQGSEWIVLEGLHPNHPRLRTRLPDAKAFVRVRWQPEAAPMPPAPLNADTLRIDGDAGRCSLTWRGVFPVGPAVRLDLVRVTAGLEIAGQPIDWSRAHDATGPAPHSSAPSAASLTQTVSLGDTLGLPPDAPLVPPTETVVPLEHAGADALPFPSSAVPRSAPSADIPGAPWSQVEVARAPAPRHEGTLVLDIVAHEPEPLPPPPPAPTPAPVAKPPEPARASPWAPQEDLPPAPAPPPPRPATPQRVPVGGALYGGFAKKKK